MMANSLPKHKVPTSVYKACLQLSFKLECILSSDNGH